MAQMVTTELENDALATLCTQIDTVLQRLTEIGIDSRSNLRFSIVDIAERFGIWATNIGAKQKSSITTSLQFRVREAPKLGKLFLGCLQDLHQDLDDLTTALDEQPLSVFENVSLTSYSVPDNDDEWSEESDPVIDVAELLKAASEDISGLFSLSIAARKASGRDRYARALEKVAASDVLSEDGETQQVTDLYPTLRFPELHHLKMQLVNANNIRRRYLKYCEEHQKASARDTRVVESQALLSTDTADTLTIGAATRASNVLDEAFEIVSQQPNGDIEFEQQSMLSYETQTFATLVYEVPRLEEANGGNTIFVCQFCRMEQSIKTQSAWRRHVFADLKAYACTFRDCSLMFGTSREWFAHELAVHRKTQRCPYCEEYDASQDLSQHMNDSHANAVDQGRMSTLLKSSVQEIDRISVKSCHFCDWHTKITSVLPKPKKDQDIFVSLQRFRRHVGAHLEEVALSTAVEPTTAADLSPDTSGAEEHGKDEEPESFAITTRLASNLLAQGQISEAVQLLQDRLQHNQASSKDSPARLKAMSQLAMAYQEQGKLPEAQGLQGIIVEKYVRMLGDLHGATIASKLTLAKMYQAGGGLENAINMLRDVVEARTLILGEDHPDRLASQRELAIAYMESGQPWKAIELLEQVTAKGHGLAEDHPDRLASEHDLARAYRQNGRTEDAVKLFERVVEVRERLLVDDHPDRLSSQEALAGAYQVNSQFAHAVRLLEKIVGVRDRTQPEDDPDRIRSQHKLAIAYRENGQVLEAVQLLEHVVAIRQQQLGEHHPHRMSAQHDLARAYLAAGQLTSATKLLEEVVAASNRVLGRDDFRTLSAQEDLARAYRATRKTREAAELLENTYSDTWKVLGKDHPMSLRIQSDLGVAYQEIGMLDLAVEVLERVADAYKRISAEDDPDRIAASANLSRARQAKEQK